MSGHTAMPDSTPLPGHAAMSAAGDRPWTIFLSAAEASGDEHAANLIGQLRLRLPRARFVGVAGPRMAAAGCEVIEDLSAG